MAQELAMKITLILCPLLLYSLTFAQQPSWVESKCGDVVIPFPFYMNSSYDCSIDHRCSYLDKSFEIKCRDNQTPFLKSLNLEVTEIDIINNRITVRNPIYPFQKGASVVHHHWSPFFYSHTNRVIVFGCSDPFPFSWPNISESGVCVFVWESPKFGIGLFARDGSGNYCCQTKVPLLAPGYDISIVPVNWTDESDHTNPPCSFLLIVDPNWLSKSNYSYSLVLEHIKDSSFAPAVLDWGIPSNSTSISVLDKVKDCHDYTVNTSSGIGLLRRSCQCPLGVRGNPYAGGRCIGNDDNERKREAPARIITGLVASLGSISLLIVGWCLYKVIKKRMIKKLKEKYFKQNGGLLLQQKLSSSPEINTDVIKLFSLEGLEKATDYFNVNRILGKGGQGTVYKGMLVDGKIIAVKKQEVQGNVEEFINEIFILAQINHRNVVKLLGCCLEAKFPLLVYEFIPNGTLFYHLHEENEEKVPIPWDMRLIIATEVAGALFYLHSAASQPIYHRDIKSTNILLDEKYRAKVADFGASRLVPSIEATHVTTKVQGTFGYLDPEYYHTSQLTEKSDVYSFGVVLVELLTSKKAVTSIGSDGYVRSLASYFCTCMDENCLFDILDDNVLMEGDKEHIMLIAKLAQKCLNLKGKKRPTMEEVTVELVGIQKLRKESNGHLDRNGIHPFNTDSCTLGDFKCYASLNLSLSNETSSSDVLPLLHSTYP